MDVSAFCEKLNTKTCHRSQLDRVTVVKRIEGLSLTLDFATSWQCVRGHVTDTPCLCPHCQLGRSSSPAGAGPSLGLTCVRWAPLRLQVPLLSLLKIVGERPFGLTSRAFTSFSHMPSILASQSSEVGMEFCWSLGHVGTRILQF